MIDETEYLRMQLAVIKADQLHSAQAETISELRAALADKEHVLQEYARARERLGAATALLRTSRNFFRTCAGCESHVAALDAYLGDKQEAPLGYRYVDGVAYPAES